MKLRIFLVSVLLFFTTVFIVGKNLDKPFWGVHDWNGARYGNIARNYVRYGFFTTRFSQVENSGVENRQNFRYYTHFPPLVSILISISYRIFGIYEWTSRLIPLLATSGAIVLLFLIGRTISDWKVGLAASLLALATPMVRYFGKNPVHEPLALFFALITFLGIAKVLRKEKGWFLIYLGSSFTLLTNWSGVFLMLAVTFVLWKKEKRIRLIKLWILGIILVVGHFLHIFAVTESFLGGGIGEALLLRAGSGGGSAFTPYSPIEFIDRVRLWGSTLFTIYLAFLSLVGVYFLFKEKEKSNPKFMFGVLIYGALYPLVFSNATFIHNYFIYPTLPFLALSASYAVRQISKKAPYWMLLAISVLLVWFERNNFYEALEASAVDTLAVDVGKAINLKIHKNDLVLVTPYSFGASRLPHLSFYSDRKITMDSDSGYNWTVKVDEKDGSFKILQRER